MLAVLGNPDVFLAKARIWVSIQGAGVISLPPAA